MINLYHYTDYTGYQGIVSSGYIRESKQLDDGDDARFGTGVYLTSLPPTTSKEEIIRECWGPNVVGPHLKNGRVNYYIRVIVNPNEDKVKRATRKRKVFLHKGILRLVSDKWDGGKV